MKPRLERAYLFHLVEAAGSGLVLDREFLELEFEEGRRYAQRLSGASSSGLVDDGSGILYSSFIEHGRRHTVILCRCQALGAARRAADEGLKRWFPLLRGSGRYHAVSRLGLAGGGFSEEFDAWADLPGDGEARRYFLHLYLPKYYEARRAGSEISIMVYVDGAPGFQITSDDFEALTTGKSV